MNNLNSAHSSTNSASASAPGTCGELVQGKIDGKDFLITCPIDMWSEVTVFYPQKPDELFLDELCGDENKMSKIRKAIENACRKVEMLPHQKLRFVRESHLPIGKGMGSSTADCIAAYTATCRLFGIEPTADEIADMALSIEPSDGTMFSGIYLFDHRKGLWREPLGAPPNIDIIIIDPGGSINTVAFNRSKRLDVLNTKKESLIRQAVTYVTEGIRDKDPEKIGLGATISARANQEILPKLYLEEVIQLSKSVKALGVNIAHSGTVMGILLPRTEVTSEVAEYIQKKYPKWSVYTSKIVSGGVR